MNQSNLSQEVHILHADMCSALADPCRILILYALSETPHTVNDLAAKVGASQPTTSRHLKLLRERGIVTAARQGANVAYTLIDNRLIEALDLLRAAMRDSLTRRANLMDSITEG